MERVHYRRVSPPRVFDQSERSPSGTRANTNGYAPEREESGGFRERLIMQGIVSGLILAVVLALSLIDNGLTANAKNSLRQALVGHNSAEALFTEVKQFGKDFFYQPEEEMGALTEEPLFYGKEAAVLPETAELSTAAQNGTEVTEDATVGTVVDGYIDEDVLAELHSRTAGLDESKSPVPEPPISPEP